MLEFVWLQEETPDVAGEERSGLSKAFKDEVLQVFVFDVHAT